MAKPSQPSPQEELSQLQEQVQQSEQRFQLTFDQAALGMAHVDINGNLMQVNQKFCDIVGYEQEELLRISFQEITYAEDLDADLEYVRRMLAGDIDAYTMEKRYIRKDETLVWVQLTVSLAKDETGKPLYFISAIEDISERKRLEEELYQQQKAFQMVAENAIDIITRFDRHFRLKYVNPAVVRVSGRPVEYYQNKHVYEVTPPATAEQWKEALTKVFKTGKPQTLEFGTSGTNIYQASVTPEFDKRGRVVSALSVARDITDIRRREEERTKLLESEQAARAVAEKAQKELRKSQERLELSQRVGHIGTFEWDIVNNHIIWTPELEALYGLPPGGFEGGYENWVERVHPDDIKAAEENLQHAATGAAQYNVEFRVIWPDGTQRWVLAKGDVSEYDTNNTPIRMIGVNIDITERKETEQRLQELNATLEAKVTQRTEVLEQLNTELQRSNQELQEFAYVASHDLQEPLRKIQAFGNLLEEEYADVLSDGKSYLDRMRNAASRMRVLIDDLLTFSRVTTKAVPFSQVDLNVIAQEVLSDLEVQIDATKGQVEVEQLPVVDADPFQMRQMFQNLIGNALKFHQKDVTPIVKISAKEVMAIKDATDPEADLEPVYQIYVEDNGIGFDEKYLDRIFTVFQRLHGRGNYEGTGIGLAVVRKIVERHGGNITATSIVGEGSTFIVTLPKPEEKQEEQTDGK